MARKNPRQLSLPLRSTRSRPTAAPRSSHTGRSSAYLVPSVGKRNEVRAQLEERAVLLADRLATLLSEQVRLTVTDNTSTMISFRRSRSMVSYRVHRMFLDAPPEVVRALADYAMQARRQAGRVIDAYVKQNESKVRRARAMRQAQGLDPYGRVHDLQAMFDRLNDRFFQGRIEARIGWGREAPGRRRRSIKMGTYFHDARVIRIHPALDREEVPAFFVSFVIFHEMLHQAIPPQVVGGRRISHTPEFRAFERRYPDYERAIAWEQANLPLLLGSRMARSRRFDPDDLLA